jgi:DNA-directed RNA polymerase sigma subunit (sigma70/sigma32)
VTRHERIVAVLGGCRRVALDASDDVGNKEIVERLLNSLDQRLRTIIACRFGLCGNAQMTLQAIGLDLGLCKESVRCYESKALRKLMGPKYRRWVQPEASD